MTADPPSLRPGSSPSSCTPTCRGWPTTGAGRSARNGSTSRGRRHTCPLIRVLRTLAAEDRRGLITLGMTPVVTAQLDDPYCLGGMHHWLANWRLRALQADHRFRQSLARLRNSRARRGRARARRLHRAVAARRLPAAARTHRHRRRRTARRPAGPSLPAAAGAAVARVRAARGAGRRAAAVRPHPDRHLGARVRLRPRHGTRLCRCRRRAFHGRRSLAARRHRARPPRRRLRRRGVRPGSSGQLPGVVAEVRLSRACRLPRLPHLRPRDRAEAGPRHRTQCGVRGQGAVRPGSAPTPRSTPTSPTSSRWCAGACSPSPSASAGPRTWSPRSTPNSSGTGGTRGPVWLERVLRALPEAGVEVGTLRDAVARGYTGAPGRIAAQLLGFRQGLAGVVG